MKQKRLAIIGISGRMGQEIRALAAEFNLLVTEGVASRSSLAADGIVVATEISALRNDNVDVVIDFSLPELTAGVAQWCANHKKPLVSGVTGLTEEQHNALRTAAKAIPVLWAPNMSLGIAVMARMLTQFASLNGFEFQIEELHHKRKKDRPSGTALHLQRKLGEVVGDLPEPLAIRGGGIFGIHRIWAMGEEETSVS